MCWDFHKQMGFILDLFLKYFVFYEVVVNEVKRAVVIAGYIARGPVKIVIMYAQYMYRVGMIWFTMWAVDLGALLSIA